MLTRVSLVILRVRLTSMPRRVVFGFCYKSSPRSESLGCNGGARSGRARTAQRFMGFLHTRNNAITQDYPGVTILTSTTITALNEHARAILNGRRWSGWKTTRVR